MTFVDGICWISFAYLLGLMQPNDGIAMAQVSADCFPPEYVCPEPFWVLSREDKVSCVHPTGHANKRLGSELLCALEFAELILIDETKSEDLLLLRRLMDKFHSTGFWIKTVKGEETDDGCNAFTEKRIVEEKNCDLTGYEALCEKNATLRIENRPHLTIVRSKGVGRDLYIGTEVTLSCDVKGEKFRNLSIAYGPLTHIRSPARSEIEQDTFTQVSSSGNNCGIRTVTSFTHTLSQADISPYFFCFFSGKISTCNSHGSNENCAQQGPFQIVNPHPKPTITLTLSEAPNTVFYGKAVKAVCSTEVDIGSKIEWAYVLDNHLTRLRQKMRSVRIDTLRKQATWISTLTVQTEGKNWNGKEITLVCYSRSDSIIKCAQDHYWCQEATVQIKSGATIPYLRIFYDRDPNVIYAGGTLEARCTTDKAKRIVWIKLVDTYTGYKMAIITDNIKRQRNDDEPIIEIKNEKYGSNQEYEMSTLKIHEISENLDAIKLGCFAPKVPTGNKFDCEDEEYCVNSAPIRVLDGPLPPSMTLVFDLEPNYMYVDSTLLVQCDAHIGLGGKIHLLLYINNTIIKSDNKKLGIQIDSAGAPQGGYQTKLLRITKVTAALNGMVIGCFSYDITAHPNKHYECLPQDELCHVTQPVRVIYHTALKFSFGQDKIGKYVLMWFLWMVLVVSVHFVSWYGNKYGTGTTVIAPVQKGRGKGRFKDHNPITTTRFGRGFKLAKSKLKNK